MCQSPSLRWLCLVLVVAACTAGCAQPGPTAPLSVTGPSLITAFGMDSSAESGVLGMAPGASYDASGSWHFTVIFSSNTGEELGRDEGDITFTADSDGLHATIGSTLVTLERKGLGRKIAYIMSISESHPSCDTDVSGPAQIDIATNTLQARLTGIEEGCIRVVYTVTATKNVA